MRCLLEQIELLEQQRTQADEELEALTAQISQYITSIPGIDFLPGQQSWPRSAM